MARFAKLCSLEAFVSIGAFIAFSAFPLSVRAGCPAAGDLPERSAANFPGGLAVDGLAVSLSSQTVSLAKRLPIVVHLENVSAKPILVDPNPEIYDYKFHVVDAQGAVAEVLRTRDFDNSLGFIYGAINAAPGCTWPMPIHLADYVNITATGVYTVTVTVDIRDRSDSKTPRLVTSNTASLIVSP
jgi:hypothetical protein